MSAANYVPFEKNEIFERIKPSSKGNNVKMYLSKGIIGNKINLPSLQCNDPFPNLILQDALFPALVLDKKTANSSNRNGVSGNVNFHLL